MGGSTGKVRFNTVPALNITGYVIDIDEDDDLSGEVGDGSTGTGQGETFVRYKVETGTSIAVDSVVEFSFGPVPAFKLNGNSGDIELTYSISTDVSVKPGTALYNTPQTKIINFVDSFEFSSSEPLEATADVESNFVKFKDDQLTAAIAKFKFIPLSTDTSKIYVYENEFSAGVMTINNVFSAETTLDVVGDFTFAEDTPGSGVYTNAASRVFISSGSACGGSTIATADVVAVDKATFEGFNTSVGSGTGGSNTGEGYVCVVANGSPIQLSAYNLVLNGVGVTAETPATSDGIGPPSYVVSTETLTDAGSIIYNGTQLITPYLTIASGYISRIMLSNSGSADIDYIATVITDDGNSSTLGTAATGTIKSGTNLQINTSNLVSFSSKTRGAAIFNFVGAGSSLQGVYQTVNLDTLEVQSIIMQRPGGGKGIN